MQLLIFTTRVSISNSTTTNVLVRPKLFLLNDQPLNPTPYIDKNKTYTATGLVGSDLPVITIVIDIDEIMKNTNVLELIQSYGLIRF